MHADVAACIGLAQAAYPHGIWRRSARRAAAARSSVQLRRAVVTAGGAWAAAVLADGQLAASVSLHRRSDLLGRATLTAALQAPPMAHTQP